MIRLIAAGVVLALLAGLSLRFTAFSGDRIRSIRWRIRLRMHPGPGFASARRAVVPLVPPCCDQPRPPGPARSPVPAPPAVPHY